MNQNFIEQSVSSPTASWWLTIVQSLYYFTFHDIVLIKNKKYHKNTILKSDHRRLRNSNINLWWVLVRWLVWDDCRARQVRFRLCLFRLSAILSSKSDLVNMYHLIGYQMLDVVYLFKYNFIRLISVLRCIYLQFLKIL